MGCKTDRLPNLYATIIKIAPKPYNKNPPPNKAKFPLLPNFHNNCPIQTTIEDIIIKIMPFLFFLKELMLIYLVIFRIVVYVS